MKLARLAAIGAAVSAISCTAPYTSTLAEHDPPAEPNDGRGNEGSSTATTKAAADPSAVTHAIDQARVKDQRETSFEIHARNVIAANAAATAAANARTPTSTPAPTSPPPGGGGAPAAPAPIAPPPVDVAPDPFGGFFGDDDDDFFGF